MYKMCGCNLYFCFVYFDQIVMLLSLFLGL